MSDDVFINELMATGVPWPTATLLGSLEDDVVLVPTGGDDYALIQNAMDAAASSGKSVLLGAGGFFISIGLIWPTGLKGFIGQGRATTIIKRTANSATMNMISLTGQVGVTIANLGLDGNSTNNSSIGNGIVATGSGRVFIDGVAVLNQKGSNTPAIGSGIIISNSVDAANGTSSSVVNCELFNNGGPGITTVGSVQNLLVQGNTSCSNNSGIGIGNAAPSGGVQNIHVVGNLCCNNKSLGLGVNQLLVGFDFSAVQNCTITGNTVNGNGGYGIIAQGTNITVTGNTSCNNGSLISPSTAAGILFNCIQSACSGNTVLNNILFGIDAGGAQNCTINGNKVEGSHSTLNNNGCGINLGASTSCVVTGNFLHNNGGASSGVGPEIIVRMYDSGGFAFPTTGGNCLISDNMISITASTNFGIQIIQTATGCVIRGNHFIGGTSNNLIQAFTDQVTIERNTWTGGTDGVGITLAPAAALIIPDWADVIYLVGSPVQITKILTESISIDSGVSGGLLCGALINNPGSMFTSAPTITVTGDGSSAHVNAVLTDTGSVGNLLITNKGSLYVQNTTTLSFAGGGGSGLTMSPVVTIRQQMNGREFTLINLSGSTLSIGQSANIQLANGQTFAQFANNTAIKLRGFGANTTAGTLYEVSRTYGFTNYQLPSGGAFEWLDSQGHIVQMNLQTDDNLLFWGTDNTGAQRFMWGCQQESATSVFAIGPDTKLATHNVNHFLAQSAATGAANTASAVFQLDPDSADANAALRILARGTQGVLIDAFTNSGTPTVTDIPTGLFAMVKNTGDGTRKLYFNDGGTLVAVALS